MQKGLLRPFTGSTKHNKSSQAAEKKTSNSLPGLVVCCKFVHDSFLHIMYVIYKYQGP